MVKRERARVRRNAERQLQAIAAALADEVAEILQLRPTHTVEEVLASFDEVVKPRMGRLGRTLAGSSLPRSELTEYEAAARDAARAMRTTLEKRLPTARATADMLVRLAAGTSRNHEALDDRLRPLTDDWPLDRQPCADRNILRLAAYEMLHCPETPPAVVMNEAVELAKRYGTEESARFINGVLSALAAQEGIISMGASE